MLPLEARKYLFDIHEGCERLAAFTDGKTLEEYLRNPMLRSAVERQFEIIGEALRQMLDRCPDLSKSITDHHRIVAFRNRLIHGYAEIAHDVVWGILKGKLPRLRSEIAELLSQAEGT